MISNIKITIELPIKEDYQDLIDIVGIGDVYSREDSQTLTEDEKKILIKDFLEVMHRAPLMHLIDRSVRPYFGGIGASTAEVVISDLQNALTCVVELIPPIE